MKVIGYKWLHVDTSVKQPMRLALVSAHDAREWVRGPNRANYVPSHDYLWGFNAYHSASRARWSGRKFGTVMVGVVGFGTVALFQRGWRAETAEIVAIYTPRRFWRHIDTVARSVFIERLRATYDVPVFGSLSELRRETERWGVPARTFLRRGEYRQATADVNQRSD